MNKCLVFGDINLINREFDLLYHFQETKEIEIVGFSSLSDTYDEIRSFKYYTFNSLDNDKFDYVILMYENDHEFKVYKDYFLSVYKNSKILKYEIFKMPYINLIKYLELYNNTPTIFCNSCNGGILYHTLGLGFKSPLINLLVSDDDYIKFLQDPDKYLNSDIKTLGYDCDLEGKKYPTCLCDDIVLKCVHYKTHEDVAETWRRRVKRVDLNNIFVLFITDNKESVDKFVELPYKKKICICPFDYNNECVFKLDLDAFGIGWFLQVLLVFENKMPTLNLLDLLHDAKAVLLN